MCPAHITPVKPSFISLTVHWHPPLGSEQSPPSSPQTSPPLLSSWQPQPPSSLLDVPSPLTHAPLTLTSNPPANLPGSSFRIHSKPSPFVFTSTATALFASTATLHLVCHLPRCSASALALSIFSLPCSQRAPGKT